MSVSSRFERMVAIPEEEYKNLKAIQMTSEPLTSQLTNLSNEYNKQNLVRDSYSRIHRQGELLEAMKDVKDNMRDALIQATPKVYQTRAESLYTFLSDKLFVTENGELRSLDGNVVKGSNISNLIQYAVRDRRSNIPPIGWEYFLHELVQLGAPKMLLNYETLDEMNAVTTTTTPPRAVRARPATPVTKVQRGIKMKKVAKHSVPAPPYVPMHSPPPPPQAKSTNRSRGRSRVKRQIRKPARYVEV